MATKKKKQLKQGDAVYVKAKFWKSEGDGYYELVLPEGLEYRFAEASMPMATIHKDYIKF